jgi:hypothetical protein
MRRVIAFVTSRYGLAGLAALAVILIVTVGRLMGLGGGDNGSGNGAIVGTGQGDTATSSTASPVPNDAPTAAPTKPDPVVKPGEDGPMVVAREFADAYLDSTGKPSAWRAALTKYATAKLAGEIKTMDPATVPAERITGALKLGDHGATWAEIDVPTDSGTLIFRLLSGAKAWQVDGIDWDPKS